MVERPRSTHGRELRVLLVEDSDSDTALVEHELRRAGYLPSMARVDSEGAMRERLDEPWDVILCDYNLPSFDAFGALGLVERHAHDAPLVVLSGTVGEETAVALLKAGARDCVLKSNLKRIGPVIERELAETELRRRRQAAELALRETSSLLQAILDASPLAIVAADLDRRVTLWSRAAERMFGWTAAEVTGRRPPTIPDEELSRVDEMFARLDAGETLVDVETTRIRRDGTKLRVSISTAPLTDEHGRRTGSTSVLADISRRKESEEAVARGHELARKAAEERRWLLDRLVRAQEEERERIASDIHDDSVQVMTALVIRLHALRRRLDDPDLVAVLDEVEETARKSITRLRRLTFELRPAALDRDGLAPALRLYLEGVSKERGLVCELLDGLTHEPGPETRAVLYRIAQEALTNVVKHADASRITVTVEEDPRGTVVRIVDDGRGFAPGLESAPGHLGLASMRERAELSGGWWRIDSAPGAGTVVEFFVPEQQPSPVALQEVS